MNADIRIKTVVGGSHSGWEYLCRVTRACGAVEDGVMPRQTIIALRPLVRLEFEIPKNGRIEIEAC